jgi:hypothetical protein
VGQHRRLETAKPLIRGACFTPSLGTTAFQQPEIPAKSTRPGSAKRDCYLELLHRWPPALHCVRSFFISVGEFDTIFWTSLVDLKSGNRWSS